VDNLDSALQRWENEGGAVMPPNGPSAVAGVGPASGIAGGPTSAFHRKRSSGDSNEESPEKTSGP
jgi:hypothetical protein